MASDAQISVELNRDWPADAIRPVGVDLDRQRQLKIRWADGHESVFPLTYLRAKCPCATCRTPAAHGEATQQHPAVGQPSPQGLSLNILPANFNQRAVAVSAGFVGNYAIQIRWADGHDTGIYDFRYLRGIDPVPT